MRINNKKDKLVLILLSIAFILVDWRIGDIALSDILLFAVFLLLLMKGKFIVKPKQFIIYIFVLLIVFLNIILNLAFNMEFIFMDGVRGLVKVLYYMTIIMLLYNYIRSNTLEKELLKVLGISAAIVSFIGIYIVIAIYSKDILPFEFIWKYTRTDLYSYTYRGWGRNIIRARSVFSEPAHLGFYLNSVLAIFYFNKAKYKIDKKLDLLLTTTLLLTFSFSAIGITLVIKTLYYADIKQIYLLFTNKKNVIGLLLLVVVMFFMRETIQKTIFIRIYEMLSGSDGSGTSRIIGSWSYINKDNLFLGNGIGNTPEIFNIYAYIFSDLGLISFLLAIILTISMVLINFQMGIFFIAQNFQKGGYLGAGYWILILLIIIYIKDESVKNIARLSVVNKSTNSIQ